MGPVVVVAGCITHALHSTGPTEVAEGPYDCYVVSNDWVVPDFETLYGDRPMSARMAARLWYVADSTYGSYFDGMADAWIADLPRVAQIHADEAFVAAFGERFGILADRIAGGLAELTDLTTCTADEVALHLVIDRAEELLQEGGLDWDWMDPLPRRPADDNFYGVQDYLFYDLDVLHLYDPAADGVEDAGSEVYEAEGFVNLHPRDWFETSVK